MAVFATGLLLILALEAYGLAYARNNQYLQFHSSEDLMQTLSLLDLREHAWQSLVVFRWLRRLLASTRLAAVAALAFLLHAAATYYGSLLDSTTLTSLAMLVPCYALWAAPVPGAIVTLGGAYLFLFFLRSIFQWPVLVVLIVSLASIRVPRRGDRRRLPWRGVYDWIFSSYRLLILLVAALVVWARRSSRVELLGGVGLALPVLYVFIVSQLAVLVRSIRRPGAGRGASAGGAASA